MDMELYPRNGTKSPITKLTEGTSLSLHLVLMLLVFVVWLIRLGDKVDVNAKAIARHERMLNQKCSLWHPPKEMEPTDDD